MRTLHPEGLSTLNNEPNRRVADREALAAAEVFGSGGDLARATVFGAKTNDTTTDATTVAAASSERRRRRLRASGDGDAARPAAAEGPSSSSRRRRAPRPRRWSWWLSPSTAEAAPRRRLAAEAASAPSFESVSPGLLGDWDIQLYKYVIDVDGDGCSGRLGKVRNDAARKELVSSPLRVTADRGGSASCSRPAPCSSR